MKLITFAFFLCISVFAFCGQMLFDCAEKPLAMYLNRSVERGQTLEMAAGKLKFTWDEEKFRYGELMFRKMPEFPEFSQADLKVNISTSGACAVRLFNLRLIDSKGKTFQWNKSVEWTGAGNYSVSYTITPENADLHWGGAKGGEMSFPLRFSGFSVDFHRGSGKGELYINSASILAGDGKYASVKATRNMILADFAQTHPQLRLNQGEQRSQSICVENNALKMIWGGARHPYIEWSFTSPLPLPEFISGKVKILVSTPADSPIRQFSIRMIDTQGEVFQWRKKINWQTAGQQELVFDVTPENSSFSWGGNSSRVISFPVRFLGISADFMPGSGSGELNLHTIESQWQTELPAVDALETTIATGCPSGILRKGNESQLALRLFNTVDTPLSFNATLKLTDFDGNEISSSHQLTFKPLETISLKLPQLPTSGIWYTHLRISTPDNPDNYRDLTQSFAYMTPAGPTSGQSEGFIFGICSHPNWTNDRNIHEREALAMALCGAKVMRMDMEWWGIERSRGKVDYSRYDAIVDIFARQGVEVAAILGKPPEWATTQGNLPDYDAWRSYVRGVFTHFKGRIRYWEGWNEPDLIGFATFDVPEYLKLMTIVREEADVIIPDAIILSGGFATMAAHGSGKGNFHERAVSEGKGLYDVHAYHEHGIFTHYRRMVDDLFLPMREKHQVTAPWYANETAITSAGHDERFQAVTLFKKFLFSLARGSIGYNWYNLRNKGVNPKSGEHNYGLLLRDFQPKAAYVVFNTLATLFKGKEFIRQLPTGDGVWALEFRDKDETVIAVWNENFNSQADECLLLSSDAHKVETVDLMANHTPAIRLENLYLIPAGRVPVMLRLSQASRIEQAASLMTVSPLSLVIPGQAIALMLEFNNPFDKNLQYTYSITPPEGVSMKAPTDKITVLPGSTIQKTVKLLVSDNFTLPFGETGALLVNYSLDIGAFAHTLSLPLHTATALPTEFKLNKKDQVVSLFDADPTKTHMVWRDTTDLSANVTLDVRDDKLLLSVNVRDDKHVQPGTGGNVWQGDNVQIAMMIPGQQGMWEFGLTHLANSQPEVFTWSAPRNFRETELTPQISLHTRREKTFTVYQASIPLKALGMNAQSVRDGFRFNLLVNDNDGDGRKGWIHIAPGIGLNKNPDRFPFVFK